MRSEAADRWGHDMFDPDQQGPKSNDELLTLYGYDIRQEEGAPRFVSSSAYAVKLKAIT